MTASDTPLAMIAAGLFTRADEFGSAAAEKAGSTKAALHADDPSLHPAANRPQDYYRAISRYGTIAARERGRMHRRHVRLEALRK